jgi:hypothetical protein
MTMPAKSKKATSTKAAGKSDAKSGKATKSGGKTGKK